MKGGGYIGFTMSVCLSIHQSVQSKLNLGYNFWSKRDKALILHTKMYASSLWQNLSTVPKILTLLHLYLDLDFWPFEKKT